MGDHSYFGLLFLQFIYLAFLCNRTSCVGIYNISPLIQIYRLARRLDGHEISCGAKCEMSESFCSRRKLQDRDN
jgi:hypothetical protein